MTIHAFDFNTFGKVIELAEEMDNTSIVSTACAITEFVLPDGRRVQAQLVLQTDEYEFIGEE